MTLHRWVFAMYNLPKTIGIGNDATMNSDKVLRIERTVKEYFSAPHLPSMGG
jgi:hypothetical protein